MKSQINSHPAGAAAGKLIFAVAFVAVLAVSAYLFADRSAKEKELASLRAMTSEIDALRQDKDELERLRGQVQQIEQLQQDNQELIKLRGEVAILRPLQAQHQRLQSELQQLRTNMDQLKRTATDSATLRSQNEKLQGVLAEQQRSGQTLACVANLKALAGAKLAWANDFKKAPIDIPTDAELFGPNRYIAQRPVCPGNGVYTLGPVQEKVTCTIPGHAY